MLFIVIILNCIHSHYIKYEYAWYNMIHDKYIVIVCIVCILTCGIT